MIESKQSGRRSAPPIHLADEEYDIIADLALGSQKRSPEISALLLKEIDRAKIHSRAKLPKDVVTLGSEVEYEDERSAERRRVRLVLPAEADMEEGKVSILTPMGAGLIGMKVGSQIDWPGADGRPRLIKILDVRQQK